MLFVVYISEQSLSNFWGDTEFKQPFDQLCDLFRSFGSIKYKTCVPAVLIIYSTSPGSRRNHTLVQNIRLQRVIQ